YEADLEFLSRVAVKVAAERADLGSVNPVLAHAVEARMLGRPVFTDPTAVASTPKTALLGAEHNLRAQVRRLRDQLDTSTRRLHVAPANVRRVVDTALALADQPALADLGHGEIAPPNLRAGLERTVADLADPLSGEPRPLTFDPAVARERDDVVFAHLEHPLVTQSTTLLRSAIWGGRTPLNRVAAVRVALPAGTEITGLLVAIFARLVVVGADGARLHEEVMLTARVLPESGRSRRLELEQPRYADLRQAVEAALEPDACRPAPASARGRLVVEWERLAPHLAQDVQVRAAERVGVLERALHRRAEDEQRRIRGVFEQLEITLRTALANDAPLQLSFEDLERPERAQLDRDRQAWQNRLDGLSEERDRELAMVTARYASVRELVFPFAVALCLPDGEGVPDGADIPDGEVQV
ncbi:MAG: helicase, partial [Actinobacteria bacterium]|nr:helicase [Actinomycetota bacterium]